jgi:hypothetical protein
MVYKSKEATSKLLLAANLVWRDYYSGSCFER